MGLIDFAQIAKRRWLIIVVTVIVCMGGAAFYSSSLTPSYTSASRLYVSVEGGTSVTDSYQASAAAQQRVTSYVNLVTSTDVVVPVIDQLKLNLTPSQLQSKITASFTPATVLISVAVTDSTAEGAKLLNDAVVQNFQALVAQIESSSNGTAPAAKITVVDPATAPGGPAGTGSSRYLALGLLVGLALGCGLAFLRDRLDRTIRNGAQLEEATDGPFLGEFATATAAEDSKRLALKLEFAGHGPEPRTILAAGLPAKPDPELSLSLAKALSDTGARVVVIDASTDGTGVTQHLNASQSTGLAELLRSPTFDVSTTLVEGPTPAVSVLPLGQVDDATGGLFASRRFAQILGELRGGHDYVVIDALSAHDASDILALAARSDGVVAAVEIGSASIEEVRDFTRSFAEVGSHVIGTISLTKPSMMQSRMHKNSKARVAPPKSVRRSRRGKSAPASVGFAPSGVAPAAIAKPAVPRPVAVPPTVTPDATPTEAVPTGAALNGAATNGAALNGAATNGAASNGVATNGAVPVRPVSVNPGVVQAAGAASNDYNYPPAYPNSSYPNSSDANGRPPRYTNPYGQNRHNNFDSGYDNRSYDNQGYGSQGYGSQSYGSPAYNDQYDQGGQDPYRRDSYSTQGGYDPSAYDPSAYDPSDWPPRSYTQPPAYQQEFSPQTEYDANSVEQPEEPATDLMAVVASEIAVPEVAEAAEIAESDEPIVEPAVPEASVPEASVPEAESSKVSVVKTGAVKADDAVGAVDAVAVVPADVEPYVAESDDIADSEEEPYVAETDEDEDEVEPYVSETDEDDVDVTASPAKIGLSKNDVPKNGTAEIKADEKSGPEEGKETGKLDSSAKLDAALTQRSQSPMKS